MSEETETADDSTGRPAVETGGVGAVLKAVGAGAGVGAAIGLGIAALANAHWSSDAEAEMSRQLGHLISRANHVAERLRRSHP